MSTTCEELRRVSSSFRAIAARLMRSSLEDAKNNLGRFLAFIDATPVLGGFVDDCRAKCTVSWDMDEIVANVTMGNPYQTPLDEIDEVVFVHELLGHILASKQPYESFCMCYLDCGRKVQNYIDQFHQRVIHPFYDHLIRHLDVASAEMGCRGKETHVQIDGDVTMLSIAQDQSTINAVGLFIKAEGDQLRQAADAFITSVPLNLLSPNETDDLKGLLDEAIKQSGAQKPKRWVLTAAMEKVKSMLPGIAKDVAASMAAQTLLNAIQILVARIP